MGKTATELEKSIVAEDLTPDFVIMGDLDFAKTYASVEDGGGKSYEIFGKVLNRVKDASGETPILEKMDWGYFDKGGMFKYEHDPRNAAGNPVATPRNVIGVPHERSEHDNHVFLTGALLKGQPMAEDTVSLIKALADHNKRFPDHKRTLGFSIEGKYLYKSGGKYAGKVINAVLSPNPQDVGAWVEAREKNNRAFAKSLSAGVGVAPGEQSGGGALRRESLEGSPKSQTWNGKQEAPSKKKKRKKNRKGGEVMAEKSVKIELEVGSYEDAVELFKSEQYDYTDVEAEERARVLFAEESEEDTATAEIEELQKTVTENSGLLKKLFSKLHKSKPAEDEDEVVDGPPLIDATSLIQGVQKSLARNEKSFAQSEDALGVIAKTVASLAELQVKQGEFLSKSVATGNDNGDSKLQEGMDVLKAKVEEQDRLIKALEKTEVGMSFVGLAKESLAEGAGGGVPITKSEVTGKLLEAQEVGKVSSVVVTAFEVGEPLPGEIFKSIGYAPPLPGKLLPAERLEK